MNTGGPAFPINIDSEMTCLGITVRDYFAAKAMQGLMSRDWSSFTGSDEELISVWAKSSYFAADAMLRAREQ